MLVASQNQFIKDLYLALSKQDGNLFFSPFSISAALAMVYMGSKDSTESQLQETAYFPPDKSQFKQSFHDLISDFKTTSSDYELKTSNMAYISHLLSVREDYKATLTNDFLSSINLVNFGNSEPVRKEINAAVEKETNSKIKDLIPSGVLDEMTRMVLVNAIYFKGLWQNKFNSASTKTAPFWINADESVNVEMMNLEKEFKTTYNRDLDAKILVLDYQGDRFSMVIVLPEEKEGLASLEEKLGSVDFEKLSTQIQSTKLKVSLPKFKLKETLDLNEVLKKMGITHLFDPTKCDLSGINGEKDLHVSKAIHQAVLEVNEEGSEAAAATGMVMMTRCLMVTERFVADRPFFFFIRDNKSSHILFTGRLKTPDSVSEKKAEL